MEKGLAIIENAGEGTKTVFIDQDVLECARLNLRTKKRIEEQKKEHSKKSREKKRMERMKNRIRAELVGAGVVAIAGMTGMVHALLWVPTSIILLCAACVGLGACLGVKK
jgi:hypothetical protein